MGNRKRHYKKCVICRKEFPSSPSDNKTTCGKKCSKIRRGKAKTEDIIGKRFVRLKVISIAKTVQGRGHYYLCKCDCNKMVVVRGDNLRGGVTESCGCIKNELLKQNAKKAYKNNFVEQTSIPAITTVMSRNNTSGIRGVSWHKGTSKWVARIGFQGKAYSLGYYDNIDDAAKARKMAEKEMFGNFLLWYRENHKKEASEHNRQQKTIGNNPVSYP